MVVDMADSVVVVGEVVLQKKHTAFLGRYTSATYRREQRFATNVITRRV